MLQLSGSTRVLMIVGDPIAQVKSPEGVTRALRERGRDAVCVPTHVAPRQLAQWLNGVSLASNLDGIIVTVPHKFDCFALCATVSDRARFLGAVNTMRRNPDGSWHGDHFDGLGFVQALRNKGIEPAGRRAKLIGAGGAGTAIGHALCAVGVHELAVHDIDPARRDALIGRLAALGAGRVHASDGDPRGFDLIAHASPQGMRAGDALPLDVSRLAGTASVGCVITAPEITPLIAAARARGCVTVTGVEMFERVCDLMVSFFLDR